MRLSLRTLIAIVFMGFSNLSFATTGQEFAELFAETYSVDVLISNNKLDEALQKTRDLYKRHENAKEPAVINILGRLLTNEAEILIKTEKYREAKLIISKIHTQYDRDNSNTVPYFIMKSYHLLGMIGEKRNEQAEKLKAYENLIRLSVQRSFDPNGGWILAHALVRTGYDYEMTGYLDRARLNYEEITRSFGQPQNLTGFFALEEAYYRLVFLDFMEKPGEGSLASQNRYLQHFDGLPNISFDEHVAIVLYGKSLSLQMLNRKKELKSVLQTWLKRFGNRKERPYTDHQDDVKKTLAKLR